MFTYKKPKGSTIQFLGSEGGTVLEGVTIQEMVKVCGGGRGLWGDVQSVQFYGF